MVPVLSVSVQIFS
uniref:Uncharacterized protein n=1 Tax=Anguilla anguilla TaxID=7936 RepID=A0A0E9RN69_ANGAN